MKLLDTCVLDGFNAARIDEPAVFDIELQDGRQLDYETLIGHTPAVTSEYDGFCQPQMQFNTDELPDWDETVLYPAGRLDTIHGRNLEVLAARVAIEDQFGNHFQSICIKGSDLSGPALIESPTASRDYIIHGLQESLVMERVIRASQVLREHGVETEYICGLVLPESFPVDTGDPEKRGLDGLSRQSLPQLLERLATRYAQGGENAGKTPLEVKADMIELFQDCDYLVTYRAMDCPYRFGELADEGKFEAFLKFIAQNNDGPELDKYLEEIDPVTYLMCDLIPNLAVNVAKMHKIGRTEADSDDSTREGVTHGFLHANNISALGSIIDLDSCKGIALGLGDKVPTQKQFFRDIRQCIQSIETVYADMRTPLEENALEFLQMQDVIYVATSMFLVDYVNERFDDQESRLAFLAEFLVDKTPDDDSRFSGLLLTAQLIVGAAYAVTEEGPKATNPQEIPVFDPESLTLEHHDSFLRGVPPKFFIDMADQFMNTGWTMNEYYEELADNQKAAHNPIKASLRDLSLRTFVRRCKETCYVNDALGFLNGIDFGIDLSKITPEAEFTEPVDQKFHEYFVSQTRAIIERLGNVKPNPYESVLAPLFGDYLDKMREHIGYLPPSVDHDIPPTPIIYVASTAEYAELFAKLGITDSNLDITLVTPFNALQNFREDDSDTLLIADYGIAGYVAEDQSLDDVLVNLFGYRSFNKPLVVVRGLTTGKLKLEIVRKDDEDKESEDDEGGSDESESAEKQVASSRQLLLEMGALNGTRIDQQQLFDAAPFWTKSGTDDKLV